MAVHRKRPLLRDPISGKRPRRRLLLLSALIVVGGLGFLTSAEAQEGSLSGGAATFAAGKFDSTVRLMTGVLQGDNVRPEPTPPRRSISAASPIKSSGSTPAPSPISAPPCGSGCRRPSAPWRWSIAASPTRPRASRPGRRRACLGAQDRQQRRGRQAAREQRRHRTPTPVPSISAFATEVRTESGRTSTVASALAGCSAAAGAAPRNAEAANPGSWTTTQGRSGGKPSSFERQSSLPLVGIGERLIERT